MVEYWIHDNVVKIITGKTKPPKQNVLASGAKQTG
jgi:hypothetical protein